jgi:hypothetical protein
LRTVAKFAGVGLVTAVVGCTMPLGSVGGPEPDAGADAGIDAQPFEDTLLVFDFEAKPPIPATFGGDFQPAVEGAHVKLDEVRAICDASVTRPTQMSLDWTEILIPPPLELDDAAPGLYSQLRARVTGYELYGSVIIDGDVVEYEIVDVPDAPVPITFELVDCIVEAGKSKNVKLHFESKKIVEEIDWRAMPRDADGVIRLGGDKEMREHLREAFGEKDDD